MCLCYPVIGLGWTFLHRAQPAGIRGVILLSKIALGQLLTIFSIHTIFRSIQLTNFPPHHLPMPIYAMHHCPYSVAKNVCFTADQQNYQNPHH